VLVQAGAASAAKNVETHTETRKNVTESFREDDPCLGPSRITITFNDVFHITEFVGGPNAGTVHVTFTQAGRFVIDPLAVGLPTFTGHFAIWGGFNGNRRSAAGTFTFNAVGRSADGTLIRFHSVEHFNVTPGGVENSFSFESTNCPV
jgi:hypothetical protein